MKKVLAGVSAFIFAVSLSFGQVMQEAGFENNVFTGFGTPLCGNSAYYGFVDTIQARLDVNQFTLEGMLNWGALAEWAPYKTHYIPYYYEFEYDNPIQINNEFINNTADNKIKISIPLYKEDGGYVDSYTIKNTPRSALGYLMGYHQDPESYYQVLNIGTSLDSYIRALVIAEKKKLIDANFSGIVASDLYNKYGLNSSLFNVYNGYKNGQTLTDDYYVNFVWHPEFLDGFDFGIGTKLNWQVGPAPRFGSWLWEADAHVRQGGFSTGYDDRHGSVGEYQFVPDAPGSADVVGFIPYANKYAKKAIGIRWRKEFKDNFKMEAGAAIPDGTNTDSFRSNMGLALDFSAFKLALAYEGLFQTAGNFYAGASFNVNQFCFDVYSAWDGIGSSNSNSSFSTGAAMTIKFEKPGITIRPEGSINFFENEYYTPAWYAGGLFQWDITKRFTLSAWSSFAVGSKDTRWDDYYIYNIYLKRQNWGTGHILDFRPEIILRLNERHTFSGYLNIENRVAFDGTSRDCWSTGIYWTYKVGITKASAKAKK